jgi:hypothetical protein
LFFTSKQYQLVEDPTDSFVLHLEDLSFFQNLTLLPFSFFQLIESSIKELELAFSAITGWDVDLQTILRKFYLLDQ